MHLAVCDQKLEEILLSVASGSFIVNAEKVNCHKLKRLLTEELNLEVTLGQDIYPDIPQLFHQI